MSNLCDFGMAWTRCNQPAEVGKFCKSHAATKCCVCSKPATHECSHTGQFVCGFPLCEDCEGHCDESKPFGAWGFMNHSHRPKPVAESES